MKMKHIATFYLSLLLTISVQAQTKQTGFKLGISLIPNVSQCNISSVSNAPIFPQSTITFKQVADSVKKMDKMDVSLGFGFSFMYNIKREIELQTGISYYQVGFLRTVNNYKFLDPVYPGGPLIYDQSADHTVHFHYRFKYIQVPVLFNFGIPFKNMNFQYNLYGTAGISLNYLAGSNIKTQFEGFTVDNKTSAKFDSTGFDLNKVNMNACVGFRFEYLMKNKIIVSIQPLFNYGVIPASSGDLKMRTAALTVALGVNYRFQKKDDKKQN